MTTLAIGHFLRMYDSNETLIVSLQNFYIQQAVAHDGASYLFSPFGFSGLTSTREGELSPATVVFPNNEISRGYLSEALRGWALDDADEVYAEKNVRQSYVAEIDVMVLNPERHEVQQKLLTYVGQATSGSWDDTTVSMSLSSVFDAVQADVPGRTLHRGIVGGLPTSAQIRLR
nr:putative phage minor tail protein [uncultured Mediterranean phage uvMED]